MPPTRKKPTKRARQAARKPARKAKAARAPFPLPEGWKLDKGGKSITRALKTKDFVEAVDLIQEVRDVAEGLQHHPDLHLERYNRLTITTYSHDVGKLTERDQRLATRLNDVLAKRGLGSR
jgi:4a-hydroxytetrahydrobiopterin dehydratase